jgi:hypothetical protein
MQRSGPAPAGVRLIALLDLFANTNNIKREFNQ